MAAIAAVAEKFIPIQQRREYNSVDEVNSDICEAHAGRVMHGQRLQETPLGHAMQRNTAAIVAVTETLTPIQHRREYHSVDEVNSDICEIHVLRVMYGQRLRENPLGHAMLAKMHTCEEQLLATRESLAQHQKQPPLEQQQKEWDARIDKRLAEFGKEHWLKRKSASVANTSK